MSSCLSYPLLPLPIDDFPTPTSQEQESTERVILEQLAWYLAPSPSHPAALEVKSIRLEKSRHIQWLVSLLNPLPAPYTSLDASRPWLLYWVTHSLALMNAQLDPTLKRRAVETIKSFWNPAEGGFGGGPGQMAHLAPTYASVSALCYLGGPGEDWDWIDRQAIHDWMVTLKQPDGSFVMHRGGEVDVRGCYCALTTATLLNILTPDLARATSDFIVSCQTYEGGLASASHPSTSSSFSSPSAPPQLGEAHGGYTFCALASYFMLNSTLELTDAFTPASDGTIAPRRSLNLHSLLRWSSHMQGLPIEAGGFRGRSNKLVDGCYSWWCGGLFTLIDALLPRPVLPAPSTSQEEQPNGDSRDEEEWEDEEARHPDLFNRRALQEYVLIAAQAERGGLRDKPGKGSDAYHSCYNLSGMAAAQHAYVFDPTPAHPHSGATTGKTTSASSSSPSNIHWERPSSSSSSSSNLRLVKGAQESEEEAEKRQRALFTSSLGWNELEGKKLVVGDRLHNELMPNHPVYNLVIEKLEVMLRWSYGQEPKVGIEEL